MSSPSVKSFQFLNIDADAKIPLPDIKEIGKIKEKINASIEKTEKKDSMYVREPNKHDRTYDLFCKWYSVPQDHRKPATEKAFERYYKIPKGYCSAFKRRDDFYQRYYRYMFEWIRELYPEFIRDRFLAAKKENDPASIKFFGEMVAKDLEVEKPRAKIQPFMIIGVDQSKIDKMFIPDELGVIEDVKPIKPG